MSVALGLLLAAAFPADLAVDQAGRAFVVARTASSVESRVAAPGEAFGSWRTLLRTRRRSGRSEPLWPRTEAA